MRGAEFDYKQRKQTQEYKDNYAKIKGMNSDVNKKARGEKIESEDKGA